MTQRDIVDLLTQIANLKPGEQIPPEFEDENGNWAAGFSKMCADAAAEIRRLRRSCGEEK